MRISSRLLFFVLLSATLAFGWGDDGHKIINRAAVTANPPTCLRSSRLVSNTSSTTVPSPTAGARKSEYSLKEAQEPDHFIDLERVEDLGELPEGRWEYVKLLYAKRAHTTENPDDFLPEKVGFQPYAAARSLRSPEGRLPRVPESQDRWPVHR